MTRETRLLDVDTAQRFLVDTTPFMSCDECFERMDTFAEAATADPAHTDPAMNAHLRGCSACAEEADSLLELLAADDRATGSPQA